MVGKTLEELNIGDQASFTKMFTQADVNLFAEISGDLNPVHIDEEYAKKSIFHKRVVHGALVASLFSTVLGTSLPGCGSIYLNQESKFIKPVFIDDTITATVIVNEIIAERNRVVLGTVATNQHGETVVVGHATLMPRK